MQPLERSEPVRRGIFGTLKHLHVVYICHAPFVQSLIHERVTGQTLEVLDIFAPQVGEPIVAEAPNILDVCVNVFEVVEFFPGDDSALVVILAIDRVHEQACYHLVYIVVEVIIPFSREHSTMGDGPPPTEQINESLARW